MALPSNTCTPEHLARIRVEAETATWSARQAQEGAAADAASEAMERAAGALEWQLAPAPAAVGNGPAAAVLTSAPMPVALALAQDRPVDWDPSDDFVDDVAGCSSRSR